MYEIISFWNKMDFHMNVWITNYIGSPLGLTYIGESAKAYGLKVRCLHGEHVGEHNVNLGNILGTH
jgi:hypothetical protein